VRVVLTGLPRFTRQTAFLARNAPADDSFVVVDRSTRLGKLRLLLEVLRADAVFAHWGTLRRSRAFDLALRLRKRVVQFWAGTDVFDALVAADAGLVYEPFRQRCVHLCESEWTREELAAAGVRARVVPLAPLPTARLPTSAALPRAFSVLAYAGQPREDFYRLPAILRLARAFPRVPFRICGTGGGEPGREAPPNVEFLGWVDDLAPLYRDAVVFLRIPEHDGCSFSVREALAWGRHVIASYPYPHCLVGADDAELAGHLHRLEEEFRAGTLEPNRGGREFVLAEYDETKVYARLRPLLAP
jgi:hypothetical protein